MLAPSAISFVAPPAPIACTQLTHREWFRHLAAALALTVFIAGTYLGSQRVNFRPVHWLRPTALDRAIPVAPLAVYLYVTFYPFLWIVGLLCDRTTFRRYLIALVATAALSCVFFVFFPTGVARGEIETRSAPALYGLITRTDLPRNALPSEHASLSIIAALVCRQALCDRPLLRAVSFVWIALILWSTLAIRQHVLADLLAGAALGFLVWQATALLERKTSRDLIVSG